MAGNIPHRIPGDGAKRLRGRNLCIWLMAIGFWSLSALNQGLDASLTAIDSDILEVTSQIEAPENNSVAVSVKKVAPFLEQSSIMDAADTKIEPVPRKKPKNQTMDADRIQLASLRSNSNKALRNIDRRVHVPVIPNPRAAYRNYPDSKSENTRRKLFGSIELQFPDERRISGWSRVYNRFNSDVRLMKDCMYNAGSCEDNNLQAWGQELRTLSVRSQREQFQAINSMVNQFSHRDDLQIYGASDYWASPREFLNRSGDCEDFALMKFASLIALGVDPDTMRIVVGTLPDGRPHAFLTVQSGSSEYILDNRQNEIFISKNRKDYIPKYSLNLSSRWTHVMPPRRRI